MSGTNPNYLAGGDISPSRFVGISDGADNRVEECNVNGPGSVAQPVGISQEGTKAAPIPSASALAAEDGDPIHVYGQGEQCLLQYGASVTRGDFLRPDTDGNGKGIPVESSGEVQLYGAIALESGSDGELHKVQVVIGKTTATAS